MQFDDIHPDRVTELNDQPLRKDAAYVLYWMQQSQRAEWNHALEYAIRLGRELNKAVLVGFGLMDGYPGANARHYTFMLEGLRDVQEAVKDRDCKLVVRRGHPAEVALELGERAAAVVCDRGYLRHQRTWRERVATEAKCRVFQVESDVIVPVEQASDKKEYAARTIRPRLQKQFEAYLAEPARLRPPKNALYLSETGEEIDDVTACVQALPIDQEVRAVEQFQGGTRAAKRTFESFLEDHLDSYDENRNQPHTSDVSHMSKYLHFGQISPVYLLKEVRKKGSGENVESFLEELLVRRELAVNFCFYEKDYDRFDQLPGWAKETLEAHATDEREYVYTRAQLEAADTHDPYWNAAMQQMKNTGYLHNHMRMYWGKQILAWTKGPREAFDTALYLNNKYFLDGRDCNSYANVAWLFGQHDRGWKERAVFGKVRIMTASGLERKTDPEAFVKKVKDQKSEVRSEKLGRD